MRPADPPPPPEGAAIARPPPPPACPASAVSGYACTLALGERMALHYLLTGATLKARLECASCSGWVALGFPRSPGAMVGATAILGAPGGDVGAYDLGGKSASSVSRRAVETSVP